MKPTLNFFKSKIENRVKKNKGEKFMMDKYFEYKKNKTNFRTEVIAGVTTFLTMAYIMFLNPFILSGEFARRPTLMFNGYEEEVSHLYKGMDLEKNF